MPVEDFTPGAAIAIAYRSVTDITGSGEPIEPLFTLDKYNMRGQDVISVQDNILNNNTFGLPHFGQTMNPNAIKDLTPSFTLQHLADVIFDNAAPLAAPQIASVTPRDKGKKRKRKAKTDDGARSSDRA